MKYIFFNKKQKDCFPDEEIAVTKSKRRAGSSFTLLRLR